jgi:2-polyprenyl-3-methyl-5-hydroxy-6-metoxy-1,4-benzoquinol methylase
MNYSHKLLKFNKIRYSNYAEYDGWVKYRIEKIINLSGNNNRILDIGCYDGKITKRLVDNGNQVVGIDISGNAVRLCKKQGLNVFQHDIENNKLPSKLGKFDLVVAGEIIEHVVDTDSFIKNIAFAIKLGGYLILSTPNLAGLGCRVSLLFGHSPLMVETNFDPKNAGHLRYFTHQTLAKLLDLHGFKVIESLSDSVGLGTKFTLPLLADIIPELGRTIIIQAKKERD